MFSPWNVLRVNCCGDEPARTSRQDNEKSSISLQNTPYSRLDYLIYVYYYLAEKSQLMCAHCVVSSFRAMILVLLITHSCNQQRSAI